MHRSERADLVVAGCAILEAIIEIWPAKNLGVADRGIREGIFRSLMARDGWTAVKRLKTAKGRKISSTRWLERQLNDPYVQRAKAENYRSRAPTSCSNSMSALALLKGVRSVVDLGIAPGGWSQVVRRKAPAGQDRRASICFRPTRSRASRSSRWISWTMPRRNG